MFLSRNKKNIDTFWLKKAPYQELWVQRLLLGGFSTPNFDRVITLFKEVSDWITPPTVFILLS